MELDAIIDEALAEDGAADDCTVAFLQLGDRALRAHMLARAAGVIAGVDVASRVFRRVDEEVSFSAKVDDGDRVNPGDLIAQIDGPASGILASERVALNFLQRLSGIATLTAAFVTQVEKTGIRILDTRKTTPLMRQLERAAVRAGGGHNHRFNLSDMILIKENHIRAAGGPSALLKALESTRSEHKVEVEVDSMDLLQALLGAAVDRIMLDNFSPDAIRRAVATITDCRAVHPDFNPQVEVSGGVHLGNVRDYAIAGVDFISVGALTHSAPALDISLEVVAGG
jgi:nicotinate-nucleotide pyrophosphorylase (carboxylating)